MHRFTWVCYHWFLIFSDFSHFNIIVDARKLTFRTKCCQEKQVNTVFAKFRGKQGSFSKPMLDEQAACEFWLWIYRLSTFPSRIFTILDWYAGGEHRSCLVDFYWLKTWSSTRMFIQLALYLSITKENKKQLSIPKNPEKNLENQLKKQSFCVFSQGVEKKSSFFLILLASFWSRKQNYLHQLL